MLRASSARSRPPVQDPNWKGATLSIAGRLRGLHDQPRGIGTGARRGADTLQDVGLLGAAHGRRSGAGGRCHGLCGRRPRPHPRRGAARARCHREPQRGNRRDRAGRHLHWPLRAAFQARRRRERCVLARRPKVRHGAARELQVRRQGALALRGALRRGRRLRAAEACAVSGRHGHVQDAAPARPALHGAALVLLYARLLSGKSDTQRAAGRAGAGQDWRFQIAAQEGYRLLLWYLGVAC
mmetsp:Transcript_49565/g.160175  ORF Transcript_49565/g.160175 Transcript_49565/m.160175 type:complete len:240 (-) Transcript_49565:4053-4772(-)